MRTNLLLALALFSAGVVKGQIQVYSDGGVKLGSSKVLVDVSSNYDTKVRVEGDGCAFYALSPSTTPWDWSIGLAGQSFMGISQSYRNVPTLYGTFNVGVLGSSTDVYKKQNNFGRSYGVLGEAGFATDGWNYGVFGRLLGDRNGAAVYGTDAKQENGVEIPGRYAGYFNGNVRVTKQFEVAGGIRGIVLIPTPQASAPNAISRLKAVTDNTSEAEKLSGLSMVTYNKQLPETQMRARKARNNVEMGDTAVAAPQLSKIQIQDIEKSHFSLIADQVEAIYPNLVYEDEDGQKCINYIELIPVLVQSVNELRAEITRLKGEPEKDVKAVTMGNHMSDQDLTTLSQNKPNPFSVATEIEVRLASSVKTAKLYIYNLQGTQIKELVLSDRGDVKVQISGQDLVPGMYIYSLIADGKVIDSKRMIYTK